MRDNNLKINQQRSSEPKKRKAVFLDRDGTINREVDNLRRISQLRLLPGAGSAIARLNKAGYAVVIITNQPVVARGWVTPEYIDRIHAELVRRLVRHGARIDAIYYCPHHPDAELKKYRVACRCRKPEIGMIKDARKELNIDLKRSFMIGDTTRDILAGKRAGLTTIAVQTGYGAKDGKHAAAPDHRARHLADAVDHILRKRKP